jgi:histidinol-phosphate aminotransferase
MDDESPIKPSGAVAVVEEYRTPAHGAPIDLYLDKNEGAVPPPDLVEELARAGSDALRRYTTAASLEEKISKQVGVGLERVLVTAGGDDAIARALKSVLEPGREIITPFPTFEMIEKYAALAGGEVVRVPWSNGGYPVKDVIEKVNGRTAAIAVVTPNNPTGLVATADDLKKLSKAAPQALILVDLAYVEFADEDITDVALSLPNAVVVRTLSKAWGLAGLRVGWAAGPAMLISWMRAAGNPYAVSSASLALAEARLSHSEGIDGYVRRVRDEVGEISLLIGKLGGEVWPTQANFVLARFENARWVCDALAGLGIAVRIFPDRPELEGCIRITMPGEERAFERLKSALESALAPQAILFDIDDTLADVTESYRRATVATAGTFGAKVTYDDITRAKAAGDANNDWELTWRLVRDSGVEAELADVTEKFEELYQGTEGTKGYKLTEGLTIERDKLAALKARYKLGIVTGRPASDAREFLEREGIANLFDVIVTMDDGPLKPDPEPVRIALRKLKVDRAWMVGDTPDDMRSARGAGVVPVGVVAPSEEFHFVEPILRRAGASRVLKELAEIEEILP